MSESQAVTYVSPGAPAVLLARTSGHIGGRPKALVDFCSEAVAEHCGSGGFVGAPATREKPAVVVALNDPTDGEPARPASWPLLDA